MLAYASTNERCIWVSALTNRTLVYAMSRDGMRESMHLLAERLAVNYFNIPKGKVSTSFMPVHNPQDKSLWPELLGWLVTVGEMAQVEI